MKRKRAILATLCIIALLVGCDGAKDRKRERQARPQDRTRPRRGAICYGSRGHRKREIEEALDAWVFGDSPEKFMKEHPDVQSIPPNGPKVK